MSGELIAKYMRQNRIFSQLLTDDSIIDYIVNLICGITNLPKNVIKDNIGFGKLTWSHIKALDPYSKTELEVDVRDMKIMIALEIECYPSELNKDYRSVLYVGKIFFDNYDVLKEEDSPLIRKCYMINDNTKEIIDDHHFVYRVNLDYVFKKYNNGEELTPLEKSLAMLTIEDIDELKKISANDELLMGVVKKIEELKKDE